MTIAIKAVCLALGALRIEMMTLRSLHNAIILCLLAITLSYAQQNSTPPKQRVAVLPSVGELDAQRLNLLTDKVREIATKTLPQNNFILLKEDAIIEMIGQEDYFFACKEGTCIGELAKKANANYGARCDIFKVDEDFVLKFELYSVKDEAILETFTDYDAKDFRNMLLVLEERLPDAFEKMLPSVSITAPSPLIQSGIGNVETTVGGMLGYGERRYVVNLNTDPQGANLSFNGVPLGSCGKTPCKVELPEGNMRIIAALEQYETADTTISIRQNNQSINIKLKPNFGVLEIKQAYEDGIGGYRQWSLTINNNDYYYFENNLIPGNYRVKLSHECYEDISFKAGINKGSHAVFDMAEYLNLKQGVLILSAERDGEPVSESVFINGKRVGETPFSGAVPICASVEIGESRNKEVVNVKLKNREQVRYTHRIKSYSDYTNSPKAKKRVDESDSYETQTAIKSDSYSLIDQKDWYLYGSFGIGVPFMLNEIDTLFYKAGFQIFFKFEYFIKEYDFFSIGGNLNFGFHGIEKEAVKEINPYVDSLDQPVFFNIGTFINFYPVYFMYLSGGAAFGSYGYSGTTTEEITTNNQNAKNRQSTSKEEIKEKTYTVIFPIGAGLIFGNPSKDIGFFIETQYNIAPFIYPSGGYYWSINIGLGGKFGQKTKGN